MSFRSVDTRESAIRAVCLEDYSACRTLSIVGWRRQKFVFKASEAVMQVISVRGYKSLIQQVWRLWYRGDNGTALLRFGKMRGYEDREREAVQKKKKRNSPRWLLFFISKNWLHLGHFLYNVLCVCICVYLCPLGIVFHSSYIYGIS